MKEYLIVTGSVTYALRARDILRRYNIAAATTKITDNSGDIGCGYAVKVSKDVEKAIEILNKSGIKILKIK